MGLRAYQREAKAAVLEAWEEHRAVLLVLPTGAGKTYTAGEILRERAREGRILWIAHRSELLEQAARTLSQRIGLECEVEQASSRATVGGDLFGATPCVVGSVQTLKGRRLQRWPDTEFATVVVDEAHRTAAKTYRAILGHFGGARVLGLTATPDRGDGVGLGSVYDTCAYTYELRAAIEDGYLVPLVQRTIECADLDLSDVKTVAGDLQQGELERRMKIDAVLHQVAAPLVREAGERKTIVFCAGVEQAHALVDVLAGYVDPDAVAAVDGGTPTELRAERFDRFANGDLQFLVNVGVATEGFDAPAASCVAVARPTKSRGLYAQMIGRGSRTLPGTIDGIEDAEERRAAIAASAAPDCLVLDFVGNAGRHRLVSPLDILAGKPIPPEVEQRARELTEQGQPSQEALDQAEREAVERERRAEERRRREMRIRAEVAYRKQQVDPFAADVYRGETGPRATPGQLGYLKKLGFTLDKTPSRREASQAIDTAKDRRRRGLCTIKQAKLLASKGLPVDVSFSDAKTLIDGLARHGWKTTPEMVSWAHERDQGSDRAAE